MVEHDVVDGIGAALKGQQAATTADEGVDGGEVNVVLGQGLQDEVAAVGHLVGDALELGKLLGLVGDVLGKDLGLAVKDADLGGRGARVDDQDAVGLLCHGFKPPSGPGCGRSS